MVTLSEILFQQKVEIKHLLKSCSLELAGFSHCVRSIMTFSYSRCSDTKGEKKKLMEKGMVRKILANYSRLRGGMAASQQRPL